MPPKQSQKASTADGKANTTSKTHFLPPQRVSAAVKDPQATEVVKTKDQGPGGKPDKAAYEREQDAVKAEIEALQAKVNEARDRVQSAKGGGPLAEKRKALREELDALREDQSKNKSSRGKLLDQIKSTQESIQRKTAELNAARGKLPFKTTTDLDSKVRSLDAMVESGTMRIVEEKRALAEISSLKKQRKLIDALGPQQTVIDAEKSKIDELRKTLDDPTNKAANDRWTAIKNELDDISAQMAEQDKSKDKLFEERNDLSKKLDELYGQRRENTAAYKAANDKYYAKIQEDRQRRNERQKAERDAFETSKRDEVNARLREDAAAPAYEREIEDCKTLVAYFEKVSGSTTLVPEPQVSLGSSNNNGVTSRTLPQLGETRQIEEDDAFKGLTALKKKGPGEEEVLFGKKSKKGNSNKKGSTAISNGNTETNSQSSRLQPLQLPLSTLTALLALGIATPMTRNDVPTTLQALTEKRTWFTANQERVTKERIEEAEIKISKADKKSHTNGNSKTTDVVESNHDETTSITPINAIDEVVKQLGEEHLAQDREAVIVKSKVVDETAQEIPVA